MANQRAYTDEALLEDAKRYSNQVAWRDAGLADRSRGVPSHYHAARKRGPEFMGKCTEHMSRAPRDPLTWHRSHTDDSLLKSAAKFQTLNAWKKGEHAAYLAASYQRTEKGREDFWASITAHMSPGLNPYGGAYFVYACLFHQARRAYIGLSCRAEHVRREEHSRSGPAFEFMQSSGHGFEFVILQRNYPDPKAVIEGERYWHDRHVAEGWTMLNEARCGSVGTLARRVTFETLHQRALDFNTRKAFAVGDQSAYVLAKKYGWFDEITCHMEDPASVRSRARTGEKRTDAAKAKMRAAKLGTVLTAEHKLKIGSSGKATWQDPEARQKRMGGIAKAKAKGRMGRPYGWVLTADEALHLGKPTLKVGEPVPRIELTEDEKKALRRYRYQRDKKIEAFTAAADRIFAATKLVGSTNPCTSE